jgi:peptidyl-prolyl cis-trans isomerase C
MRRILFIVLIALAASPLCAGDNGAAALALVNGQPLTGGDLLAAFTSRHSGHAKFLGGDVEARRFLDILIDERLFVQEAYNLGLDEDEEIAALTAEMARSKASAALVRVEIEEKSRPSPDQVRAVWDAIDFVIQGRRIVVDTRQEAEEIHVAILRGADVGGLARACSIVDSRIRAGSEMITWGQLDPTLEAAVFALEPGQLTPVVETEDGFELVFVENRVTVPRPDLETAKPDIETILRRRMLEEHKRALGAKLSDKYHVTIHVNEALPSTLLRRLSRSPDDVVARWDGGTMTLKEVFTEAELQMWTMFPPGRARKTIEKSVRAAVNGPLVRLESDDRRLAELPEIATAVDRYRESLMERRLFRDHVFRSMDVTDDEARGWYGAHTGDFVAAEERRVAHILLSSEDEARDVNSKLSAGAEFDEIAKQYSRDFVSAGSGGDLGWITESKVPAAFKDVLALRRNEVSKPLKSEAGWHIVKVLDIRPKRQLELGEVMEKVRKSVMESKQRAARAHWRDKLRAAAELKIDDTAIRAFVAANKFKGEAPAQHGVR